MNAADDAWFEIWNTTKPERPQGPHSPPAIAGQIDCELAPRGVVPADKP